MPGRARPAFLALFCCLACVGVASPRTAAAVCGDVTGDGKIFTIDALSVLNNAVGIEVPMTCAPEAPPVENYVGYLNLLVCDEEEFTSTLTWSDHPELEWESFTNGGDDDPGYQRVDDLFVQGQVEVDFGDCGVLVFDIDAWGVYYPMPYQGGAIFTFSYDPYTESVILWLSLSPIELDAAATASPRAVAAVPADRRILAMAPAPKGLGPRR